MLIHDIKTLDVSEEKVIIPLSFFAIDFNIGLIKNYCQDTEYTQIINPSLEKQFGYEFIHNKLM